VVTILCWLGALIPLVAARVGQAWPLAGVLDASCMKIMLQVAVTDIGQLTDFSYDPLACRSRLPRARSYRIVVRGSACEAASCTSRGGTPGVQRFGRRTAPATGPGTSCELAQIQRVRLAGQPQYAARNPARATRSASVTTGSIVASAADGTAVVIGHLPARLEPGTPGQSWSQRFNGTPT